MQLYWDERLMGIFFFWGGGIFFGRSCQLCSVAPVTADLLVAFFSLGSFLSFFLSFQSCF